MISYKIIIQEKIPSLNEWYSSSHWTKRKSQKDYFKKKITTLLLEQGCHKNGKIDKFKVSLVYNSRLDPDNTITIIKIFVDSLKGLVVKDDTKKYFKGFSIEVNDKLPIDSYIIEVKEWLQEEK